MKIDSVVVTRFWREARYCFDDAISKRKDDVKKVTTQPLCITWKDGTRTYYITWDFYDRWKHGRTYKFVGEEKIYHSGMVVNNGT